MKFLINVTEVYRVDTEAEATKLINEAKEDDSYILSKYSTVKKERRQKGELVDEWCKVSLVKTFNEEKDPGCEVAITYEV